MGRTILCDALSLNRLGEREIAVLIDRVVGNSALPETIRQDIIERTDGIPLFVEEMTKSMLEAGSERWGQSSNAVAAIAVPASLHASLMARLDRLGPAKEVAQIGAVIGREFSHAVTRCGRTQNGGRSRARRWIVSIEAGLLFRQGVPPNATYLFKHALVQDAAYGTLLREHRRVLHARIAEILESQFADITENQPELLARHCTDAGQIEKAAWLLGKAGQRSLERSALVEAAEHLKRGGCPDRASAEHSRTSCRRNQASSRSHCPAHSCQRLCSARDKAACGTGTALIEQSEALGEPPEDPLLLFQSSTAFGSQTMLRSMAT